MTKQLVIVFIGVVPYKAAGELVYGFTIIIYGTARSSTVCSFFVQY